MLGGLLGAPNPAKRKALTSLGKDWFEHALVLTAIFDKRQARLGGLVVLQRCHAGVLSAGLEFKKLNKPDRTFRYGWMQRRYILMVTGNTHVAGAWGVCGVVQEI